MDYQTEPSIGTLSSRGFTNNKDWRGVGPWRMSNIFGKTKPFCDGVDQCSQGRWPPETRQHPHGVNDGICGELVAVLDDEVRRLNRGSVVDLAVRIASEKLSEIL